MNEPVQKRTRAARVEDAAMAALFVAAIWLPLGGMLLSRGAAAGSAENRRLAVMPPPPRSWHDVASFPDGFRKYFEDNFGFRPTLVRWDAELKVKWLGVSTTPDVLVGKDGWLFYGGQGALESYLALRPFTPDQMARWRAVLEARRDWLRRRGSGYLFVVVPEKQTVYPEYMPPGVNRVGKQSRLDQLVAYLKENSDLSVLDLRPALNEAKSSHTLYLRTDTHWNYYGGFTAYRAVVGELSKSFPDMKPVSASDCETGAERFTKGDLARLLGLDGEMEEEFPYMRLRNAAYKLEGDFYSGQAIVTERAGAALPRLVMFRDSFASAIIPFLAQNFSRGVYVLGYQHRFDPEVVERERPDVVIQETAERFLELDPPGEELPNP